MNPVDVVVPVAMFTPGCQTFVLGDILVETVTTGVFGNGLGNLMSILFICPGTSSHSPAR